MRQIYWTERAARAVYDTLKADNPNNVKNKVIVARKVYVIAEIRIGRKSNKR